MANTKDMTTGPIPSQLLYFSLPLLASSLIQQLYNTVDLIFVGNVLGKKAAAAVGASSLLVTCLVGFFTGLSIGSGVVASHFFGAKNKARLKTVIHTAATISLVGGLLLMIFGIIFAPTLLRWMNTPADILAQASLFIRVYFLALIQMVSYNIGAGVIRALGNSKAPMLYQLIGGLTNVAANALFLLVFQWGIVGSALATMCSQTLACALVVWHLTQLPDEFGLRIKQLSYHPAEAKPILMIGIPAGIQATALTFSNIFIQYHINALGVDSIATFAAYFKVELVIYLPIVAYGQAATTFVAQNFGASKLDRVKGGLKQALFQGTLITSVLTAFVLFFRHDAFRLFVADANVIELGAKVTLIAFPWYFIYLIMEVFSSTIRGVGKAIPPMVILVTNMCVFRPIALLGLLALRPDITSVAYVYPLTWFTTMLSIMAYYQFGNWRTASLDNGQKAGN